ncbi:MAG: YdcF family protein [Granulosicoccaceae bacterium]
MIDIFLDPLVWMAALLSLLVLFSLLFRRCWLCTLLGVASLAVLIGIASPAFANRWLATLENQYPLRQCDMTSNTLPVVTLAGGLAGGYKDFPLAQRLSNSSKNRALAALQITKPDGLLFISGGQAPNRHDDAEAVAMAELIQPMMPKGARLITETESANTYENAVQLDALFKTQGLAKDIVLVTSAAHMPRAVGVFKKRGFKICTYAVDPRQHIGVPITTLWPQVTALLKTDTALHEWVGWWYYKRQGYL